MLDYENVPVDGIFDIGAARLRDDRVTPIFATANPGELSYGVPGEQSVFSKALLQCLNGAAEPTEDANGRRGWCVSTKTLLATMNKALDRINEATGSEQQMSVNPISPDVRLHWLDGPPEVEVTVALDPETAATAARIDVLDAEGKFAGRFPVPIEPHPYATRLSPGRYIMRARFDPPVAAFPAEWMIDRPAEWPSSRWTMKLPAPA